MAIAGASWFLILEVNIRVTVLRVGCALFEKTVLVLVRELRASVQMLQSAA